MCAFMAPGEKRESSSPCSIPMACWHSWCELNVTKAKANLLAWTAGTITSTGVRLRAPKRFRSWGLLMSGFSEPTNILRGSSRYIVMWQDEGHRWHELHRWQVLSLELQSCTHIIMMSCSTKDILKTPKDCNGQLTGPESLRVFGPLGFRGDLLSLD